ncbi:MAG: MltA domain-containing protein [Coxiellaceae bacterium]|jgi:membrane-bound lytic murein transglycosylase A|nr:MltA domain-containing protein [Coxiellaceae bacterium]
MKDKTIVLISLILITMFLSGCHHRLPEHHLVLIKTSFNRLPEWEKDEHKKALASFQRSCEAITKLDPSRPFMFSIAQSGKVEKWQKVCQAVGDIKSYDNLRARKFFEFWFEPYQVRDNFNTQGLFTGYYLPELHGSLEWSEHYSNPIYAIPSDWVKVNLGLFDKALSGRTIVGQLKDKQVRPYPSRANIMRSAIGKDTKILAWCDNEIDLAFAHIQGSAVVQLPHGKQFLINYAASNGRPYTSIGKVLIKNRDLTPQNSSMQDIRSWLLQHPRETDTILNQNASYVFFKILENESPLGSEQVPLTPERSLAVDKRYIPLGVPIWLDTMIPSEHSQKLLPFHRLLIAQDTGGAIKGIIRGDIYWGSGNRAAFVAGHMKSPGSYWILLPKSDLN